MIQIIFEKENKRAVAYDEEKQIGECDFEIIKDTYNIYHTEVSNDYQGQGIASRLVDCVVENAKKTNMKITATCSYAKKKINLN